MFEACSGDEERSEQFSIQAMIQRKSMRDLKEQGRLRSTYHTATWRDGLQGSLTWDQLSGPIA